jgi:hypothetical protein
MWPAAFRSPVRHHRSTIQLPAQGEIPMPQSVHDRAAELHNLAAHAHAAAAVAHQKGDHLTAHELSQKAHEHSTLAHQHSVEIKAQAEHAGHSE